MRQLRTSATRLRWFVVIAAISLITLAASSPNSAARGGQVPGHTSALAGATPGSTTASGQCSKATAREAMARYHLLANPQLGLRAVGQLFCGPFAGLGSRGMAASAAHGVCMPFAGWGAFRYVNGEWKLIPGGYHPGILRPGIARSGNDIVEKATIRYPGESVCTASGREERLWHWNGSRLVAGSWKVISTGPKTVHLDTFNSPDRKVGCSVTSLPDMVWCSTNPPPAHYADLHRNGAGRVCDETPTDICLQNAITHATVLRVGQDNERRGFRCISEQKGITCTVIAGAGRGKGFLINAAGVSRVAP